MIPPPQNFTQCKILGKRDRTNKKESSMKKYLVTIEHDKGTIKILVTARNIMAAREIVKRSEGCPDRAILALTQIKAKGVKS